MIIQEIRQHLEHSSNPVARVMYVKDHFRVLAIGFKKSMILKDHKTPYESKLVVMEGLVMYKENDLEIKLNQYEEYMIPTNAVHSVSAIEDSLCLLIQS